MSEIVVNVTTPYVTETAYRTEVRCGETTCDVYEHGHRGSGDWAAWMGQHIIGNGGKRGYTREQALDDAAEYVRREERRRLVFDEVKAALDRESHAYRSPIPPEAGSGL